MSPIATNQVFQSKIFYFIIFCVVFYFYLIKGFGDVSTLFLLKPSNHSFQYHSLLFLSHTFTHFQHFLLLKVSFFYQLSHFLFIFILFFFIYLFSHIYYCNNYIFFYQKVESQNGQQVFVLQKSYKIFSLSISIIFTLAHKQFHNIENCFTLIRQFVTEIQEYSSRSNAKLKIITCSNLNCIRNNLMSEFESNILIYKKKEVSQVYQKMNGQLEFKIKCDHSSLIYSLLDAIQEIAVVLEQTPVTVLETVNKFGDTQLHLDVYTDQLIEAHLRQNGSVRGIATEQRSQYIQLSKGEGGYIVTYDPLDGSSVIDTNFSVGSIFSIWPYDKDKIIGKKIGNQVNAIMAIYGPRTTVILYNPQADKVQELTLINKKWVLSHSHCTIKAKANIFSPGNLRSASEFKEYRDVVNNWMLRGFTLRYTGGMVPDVCQIFIKGHGIFVNCASQKHKSKLRVLYKVASVGFLIQIAGGKTVTLGKIPLSEYKIKSYDDKIPFAAGSSEQVDEVIKLF